MKLPPFRLERYFARHEFSVPHLLCASDCESLRVADLLALEPGARDELEALWLGYTEAAGHPELRRAIAGLYRGLGPEQVLVHAGAEEAIFSFLNAAQEPGDHAVVHAPYYQSLGEVARGAGAEVTEWRGDPARGWALDLADLERALTPRTRVVVVNFPHNPTGFLPPAAFAEELAALADRRGFRLLADEVYRGLELDPADRLPPLAELSERAVSLGVMSKTYGLAGLRIGWAATRDAELLERMAAFKDYTTICNSAPSEFLATLALRHAEVLAERNRGILRANLDRLDRFFGRHPARFAWHRPRAGSVAFPELLQGDVEPFCAELAERAGVLLLPGTLYEPGSRAFRIGFGRRDLPQAVDRLEGFLGSPG
jgi:aspartate/methionine/tyrosine aminotransferase